jgi:hypothetical protein
MKILLTLCHSKKKEDQEEILDIMSGANKCNFPKKKKTKKYKN